MRAKSHPASVSTYRKGNLKTPYGEVYTVIAHLQYCGLLTLCPLFSEAVKTFIYHYCYLLVLFYFSVVIFYPYDTIATKLALPSWL